MSNPETACGVKAYTKDNDLSGGQLWANYSNSMSQRAKETLKPIFEMKGMNSFRND